MEVLGGGERGGWVFFIWIYKNIVFGFGRSEILRFVYFCLDIEVRGF